jgi:hypothetical protein
MCHLHKKTARAHYKVTTTTTMWNYDDGFITINILKATDDERLEPFSEISLFRNESTQRHTTKNYPKCATQITKVTLPAELFSLVFLKSLLFVYHAARSRNARLSGRQTEKTGVHAAPKNKTKSILNMKMRCMPL